MALPAHGDGNALRVGAPGVRHFPDLNDETRDIRDALETRAVEVVNELLGQKAALPDRRNPLGAQGIVLARPDRAEARPMVRP